MGGRAARRGAGRRARASRAALAAVLVLAVSGGLAARRPARGGAVALPLATPVHSLDPAQASWPAEALVASLLFDSPYRSGREVAPRAHLLTLPEPIGDGRTFRARIRRQAVFHDGTPVRAAQVVESLGRLAASERSGWLLAMVEGARPGERRPAGLRASGDLIVEARLASARDLELFVEALASPQAGVVRSAATASRGLGTGPFALRHDGGDRVFRANRDYFAGPPFLDGLTLLGSGSRDDHIRRFQLGRAEGSLLGASVYGERGVGRVDLVEGPSAYLTCLVLNRGKGAMSDVRLRRAVDLAIGRHRLAGEGALPAGAPGAGAPRRADPSAARREIAAAGGAPAGRPLVLLVDAEDPFGEALAPLLLRDLGEVGLDAERVVASGAAARARLTSGSWDMRLATLAPAGASLVLQLGQVLALGGQTAEAARLVRGASTDPSGELARALGGLEAERAVLPLLRRSPRLHHRPRLRGASYDALGRLEAADLWVEGSPPEGGP